MTDGFQVRAVEVDAETVQIVIVDEPRISAGGQAVAKTRIVTVNRGDESVAGVVEEFVTTMSEFAEDILGATAEDKTQSLDEYEEALEDDDLGLGMGDDRDGA